MSDLAKRSDDSLSRPGAAGAAANPLKHLPPEWREPVLQFCAIYADILKGSHTGIAARMLLWMREDGLTLENAQAAMKRLMRPDKAAGIEFPGQLMAALAEQIDADAKERRRREANDRVLRECRGELPYPTFKPMRPPFGGNNHAV